MQGNDWIIEETQGAHFTDKRLKTRYKRLLDKLMGSPSQSIPMTFKTWKETLAAYRFFNNQAITPEQILTPHYEATVERIKKEKVVLILQDTSEIDLSGRKNLSEVGYLGSSQRKGFYLHPSLAVTPEKLCLGLVDMEFLQRKELGSRGQRKEKAIEEKESYRWLKGYEAANRVALHAPNTIVVSVSDRESDIYELLEKTPSQDNQAYWLIRSSLNRKIAGSDNLKLREAVKQSCPIGEIEFSLPVGRIYDRDNSKRHPRQQRTVQQEIRALTIKLRPPCRKDKALKPVWVNVIHCAEMNPPSDRDKIEWFLLTSLSIEHEESVKKIVNWYLCRWQIETYFKILKSGCTVEKLQFESFKAISNCIALYLIISWRILYLTTLSRTYGYISCNRVLENEEWQSVYVVVRQQPPPTTPPPLKEIIFMIAQLGGFLNRKGDREPGPRVMWVGLQRMRDFTLAWKTFESMKRNNCV